MHVDMSFYRLVTDASLLVQFVMFLLLLASVVSWTMIFSKWRIIKDARREAERFEDRFWSGMDLAVLYDQLRKKQNLSAMEHIFISGFKEYARMQGKGAAVSGSVVNTAHRSMKVALSREVESLESYLSFLATVGSTSPYIGLFGTVWGIMNAFRALTDIQQATLALVAPGIAEALVATAMGLFAAIPAVIAYNRYSHNVDRLVTHYDNFMEEFTALLQRQSLVNEASKHG